MGVGVPNMAYHLTTNQDSIIDTKFKVLYNPSYF
jgi:hypothetical protein